MSKEVWNLVIEYSGSPDRQLHRSLHQNPQSACNKADNVLNYEVPQMDEWYVRPPGEQSKTQYVGYVLDRDEIDSWPIRIEAHREKVHDER